MRFFALPSTREIQYGTYVECTQGIILVFLSDASTGGHRLKGHKREVQPGTVHHMLFVA
jgi:hypothetical protein